MKDKIFGVLQRVGRSFMLPIALLPVAGLLLGIGSSFTNPTTLATYNLTNIIREGGLLFTILNIMSKAGGVVFDNLALLFAMGVAIGMAKKEKEVAALSGAISYLIMNTAISTLIAAKGGVEALAANTQQQSCDRKKCYRQHKRAAYTLKHSKDFIFHRKSSLKNMLSVIVF